MIDNIGDLPITTEQTPNDIKGARWRHAYPKYFSFIFVQRKEVEMRRLWHLQSKILHIVGLHNLYAFDLDYGLFALL